MELCVWPGDFGLLSIDIECLQFMVASKLCAAPINIKYTTKPWLSPSGSFSFVKGLLKEIYRILIPKILLKRS